MASPPLLVAHATWPDAVDGVGLLAFVLAGFGVPVLGYVFLAVDVRRYLRSLRRALVVVASAARRETPMWAARDRPPCLQALEIDLPCDEEQVLAAYRRLVKQMHPDHGGSLQEFLRLQKHFEQAIAFVRLRAQCTRRGGR